MTQETGNQDFVDAIDNVQAAYGTDADVAHGLTALREMAVLQLLYGQIEKAERYMTVAPWLRPKDARSQRIMAHAKARQGRALEAAKLLLSASEGEESVVKLRDWKEVGFALLRVQQHKLGLRCLKKSQPSATA